MEVLIMKYCPNCGEEADDEAAVCTSCGTSFSQALAKDDGGTSTLMLVAAIFMIVGCVTYGLFIIPLFWQIPMTIHVFRARNNNMTTGTGFNVCALLFCNIVAGILLLVANANNKQ